MAPFAPGVPRDPAFVAKAQGMRAIRKECRRLFAEASIPNAMRLLELCRSDDEKVSVVALKEYYDRFMGKIGDTGLIHDEATEMPDVSGLSSEQMRELHDALMVLARLSGKGVE